MTRFTPPRRRTPRYAVIRATDIAVFTRQMATLLSAGIPVVNALELMTQGQQHSGMQQLLMQLAYTVQTGGTLAQALRQHPAYFDTLYCDLIESGEQMGKLEELFTQVADYREQLARMRQQVRQACWYPIMVLIFAAVVTAVLLVYVVPQFAAVFADFGAPLPWLTQQVLALATGVQRYGWLAVCSVAIVFLLIRHRYRQHRTRLQWDTRVLHIPVIGSIFELFILTRITRTLALTLAAGVPMLTALVASASTCGNQLYQRHIAQVHAQVAQGIQLHAAMRQQQIFPTLLIQMVFIGEESGSLDAMLSKMATIYERDTQERVTQLTRLLEPLFMVVIGGLVGGLIVAMYLPIFSLNKVIG